jgi:hypothetical protein
LDDRVPDIEDRHANVELARLKGEVLLERVEPSVGDGVLIDLVHEVHAEEDWHNEGVQFLNELLLLGALLQLGTELIHSAGVLRLVVSLDVKNVQLLIIERILSVHRQVSLSFRGLRHGRADILFV